MKFEQPSQPEVEPAKEPQEPLIKNAPEIETKSLESEVKSGKAKTFVAALALLTQSACGMSVYTVEGTRYGGGGGPPLRSPEAYCSEVDRAIAQFGNRQYENRIITDEGTVILKGIKNEKGKNMTVEIFRANGMRQRIDCK